MYNDSKKKHTALMKFSFCCLGPRPIGEGRAAFPLVSTEKEKEKEKEKGINLPAIICQKSRHCIGTQATHLEAMQTFSELISEFEKNS